MLIIGHTPRLKVDNHLNMLLHMLDEELSVKQLTKQMIIMMKLIVNLHKSVLGNVKQAHAQQRKALQKGKQCYHVSR